MNRSLASGRCLWLVLLGHCLCGGAQAPEQQAFEIASIRMAGADHGYTKISPPGASIFTAENVSLKVLIGLAFGTDGDLISAKQSWLDTTLYNVTARAEGARGPSFEELQPMLRNLLVDRFGLKTHREAKLVDGYALIVGKDGFKLKPAGPSSATPLLLPNGLQAQSISMRTLAGMLASPIGRPVADMTAIAGNFTINLSFAPPNSFDSPLPSVFTAVQAQLGLRLVAQKVSTETLVVDEVQRVPSDN